MKTSRRGNRFYTQRDMRIIRHDADVRNSQVKRGEVKETNTRYIVACGCGALGCFIHGSVESAVVPFEKREPAAYASDTAKIEFARRYMNEMQAFQTGPRQGVRLN